MENVEFHLKLELQKLLDSITNDYLRSMAEENASHIDFKSPWNYSDIQFLVEKKTIYANKMILSLWSPVFAAMFGGDFKEKDAKQIPLPGKKFNDMLALVEVIHPPNKELSDDNVYTILPLVQEYQMSIVQERIEEYLLSQSSCIKNYLTSIEFNLEKLKESNLSYLKRCPVSRLKHQSEWEQLDPSLINELLIEKCDKFESTLEGLREVRMVLERKKPTTFPGMSLLCDDCTGAREQQVDCSSCMKQCCEKIVKIIRNLEN